MTGRGGAPSEATVWVNRRHADDPFVLIDLPLEEPALFLKVLALDQVTERIGNPIADSECLLKRGSVM